MAHSTAVAGEINYFFPDENGKILKVLKPIERKLMVQQAQDRTGTGIGTSSVSVSASSSVASKLHSSSNTGMVAYNQMGTSNQQQFVRIPNSYNIQQAEGSTFTVISSTRGHSSNNTGSSTGSGNNMQQSYSTGNYDDSDAAPVARQKERFTKFTPSSNMKTKLKLSSTSASVQRKRKPEKTGKGLRHFSMKVCEKVKEKGSTTYNEVADELVAEEIQNNSLDSSNCDQKNIRRRVYDALNVLMAMQIISKDKKEIRWIGLPTSSLQQSSKVEKENEERRERIKEKHQQLRELLLQQVAFKSLIERNKDAESQGIVPTPNSSIQLPFIIVNTHKSTKINCSVTNDKSEYIFKFDDQFEMHDDAEVLKLMGLLYGLDKGQCSYENIERAKALVPPNFEKYIEAYGKGDNCDSDDEMQSFIEFNNDSQGFSRTDGKSSDIDDDEELLENSDID